MSAKKKIHTRLENAENLPTNAELPAASIVVFGAGQSPGPRFAGRGDFAAARYPASFAFAFYPIDRGVLKWKFAILLTNSRTTQKTAFQRALQAVQLPLYERRLFRAMERQVRASLRVCRVRVSRLLRPYGLRLKGYEVRGWRYSPLRYVFSRRRLLPRTVPYRLMTPMQRWFDPQKRLLAYLDARDRLRAGAMCAPG